ncbi:MAG: hypothetical protein AAFY84_08705 [Pseudomonadota bacterium]
MRRLRLTAILGAAGSLILASCGNLTSSSDDAAISPEERADSGEEGEGVIEVSVDTIAEDFVRLALAVGEYDKDYVDAYHGPTGWRDDVRANLPTLEDLNAKATALLSSIEPKAQDDPRARMLSRQLTAALTRIRMAQGETFSFDEETSRLYDVVAPAYDIKEFDVILENIDAIVPGDGPLHERVDGFRKSLAIPVDKLEAVFAEAMAECRRRTIARYTLPEGERFTTELVSDKPWSGYNWYQGDYESKIEVNTDFPVIIDRAVDLGCHEGYPGHHTWNIFMEQDFLRDKGWIEYSVFALFSPPALIGEGTANYGIEMAFPGDEKTIFERDVLYPMAGLDPEKAEQLAALNKARRRLSHSRNHIARAYLDGEIDDAEAVRLLTKYGLSSPERAAQSLEFIKKYRGYVVNYNIGQDLVAAYIDRAEAAGEDRWDVFKDLLIKPVSASDLFAQDRDR